MSETDALLPITITPPIASVYLLDVAETLQNVIVPALDGAARTRAIDCLRIVSRIVSDSQLSPETCNLLNTRDRSPRDDVMCCGKAIEQANAEGEIQLARFLAFPKAAETGFDYSAFEAIFQAHPLGGERLRIKDARRLQGGRSKITILLKLEGAADLPAEIIVRQDWDGSVTGRSVVQEERLLSRLFDAGIRVPQPLLTVTMGNPAGHPFIVVPRLAGAAVGDHFMARSPTDGPLLQLAEQMAGFHSLPVETWQGMAGIEESAFTADQLRQTLIEFRATIAKHDVAPSPMVHAAIDWLDDNANLAIDTAPTLVHGDLGFHNLLVEGDDLIAILDWEITHIGNPAYDLGYVRHAVTDDVTWATFMEKYRVAGGPAISEELVEYFNIFTGIWYHQIQLQARSGLIAGTGRNIEIAALTADFAPRVLASVSRGMRRIFSRIAAATPHD